MPKKKNITIDDLAGMVQRGFFELNENHGKRFDSIERRLDRIEGNVDYVKTFMIENHGKRIETVEKKVNYVYEVLALK